MTTATTDDDDDDGGDGDDGRRMAAATEDDDNDEPHVLREGQPFRVAHLRPRAAPSSASAGARDLTA